MRLIFVGEGEGGFGRGDHSLVALVDPIRIIIQLFGRHWKIFGGRGPPVS